jgi:tetratricopeptide (TPR) repeat protein
MKTKVGVIQFSAVFPEGDEHSLSCGITHEIARRLTTPGSTEACAILLGADPAETAELSSATQERAELARLIPKIGERYESDYLLHGRAHIADGVLISYGVYEVRTGRLLLQGRTTGLRTSVFRMLDKIAVDARRAIGLEAEDEDDEFDAVLDPLNFDSFVAYCLGRESDRPKDALDQLEKALRLEPAFRVALVEYLSTCYQVDHLAGSLRLIDAYLDRVPEDSEMQIAAANLCLSFNKMDEGLGYASRCLASRPADVEPRLLMARFLFAREMPSEAQHHLQVALASPDRTPEARYALGRYYLDLGDVYRSRDEFENCLAADPTYQVALRDLQCCYYELGDFTKGIRACERLLEADPTDAGSHYNLGLIYQRMGRIHLAKKFYEEALRHDPAFYKAIAMIGEYHYVRREWDRAAVRFEEARRVAPRSAEALGRLGDCFYQMNRPRDAYRYYAWARREDALYENPRCHLLEARTLAEEGRLEDARRGFLRATELDESFSEAWNELAWTLLCLERAEEALHVLRRAIEINGRVAALHHNLLVCYEKLPFGVRYAGWSRRLARETRLRLRALAADGFAPHLSGRRRLRVRFRTLTWSTLRG